MTRYLILAIDGDANAVTAVTGPGATILRSWVRSGIGMYDLGHDAITGGGMPDPDEEPNRRDDDDEDDSDTDRTDLDEPGEPVAGFAQ